jgi:hypothetical protein
MDERMSDESSSRPVSVSPLDEARGLLVALVIVIALALVGISNTAQPTGWLRIQQLDRLRVLDVFQLYFSGPSCTALLQTSQITVTGQYARFEVPQLGTFEMQSPIAGLYAVRPLTDIRKVEGCEFNPRYIGASL